MIELYELNPHKMTTSQEKAQGVSWFIETKLDVQTLLTSTDPQILTYCLFNFPET